MTCYNPSLAWKSKNVLRSTGKYDIVFPSDKLIIDTKKYDPIHIPCGKCVGCLMDRARTWAVRCVLEASLWTKNCYITLTYNDENLPENGTLVKEHFVLFMKRLRKKYGDGIRFFQCGEYGTLNHRPHYHACLFNFDFPDKVVWKKGESGSILYRSPSLEKLWPYGFSSIGEVTVKSAAYVARYCLKKYDHDTYRRQPPPPGCIDEYTNMSRKPGIASGWFEKYVDDVYNSDCLVVSEKLKCKPPRYFDSLMDRIAPEYMVGVRDRRSEAALASLLKLYPADEEELRYWMTCNEHRSRLKVEEDVMRIRVEKLKRGYESEN